MSDTKIKTAMEHAKELVADGAECTCDDRPLEPLTGHHWKCPVHVQAIARRRAG